MSLLRTYPSKLKNFNFLHDALLNLDQAWLEFLLPDCYHILLKIDNKLTQLAQVSTIYPKQNQIFNALYYTRPQNIRVVILGQDPYHGQEEANGLAFAVNHGVRLPPSLRNIFLELKNEYNDILVNEVCQKMVIDSSLLNWANQGVLLLNCSLTVVKDQANSMAQIGWEVLTNKIIDYINATCNNVVFMLWGNFAKSRALLIDSRKHLVLTSTHPSPLSAHRGFLGCGHFKEANKYLQEHQLGIVDWLG